MDASVSVVERLKASRFERVVVSQTPSVASPLFEYAREPFSVACAPWNDAVSWCESATPVVCGGTLERAVATLRGAEHALQPVLALDIETTGLGNAETLAGLVTLGGFAAQGGLEFEQWTLMQRRGERRMLAALGERLANHTERGGVVLTYNGSSFDLPRLRTRSHALGLPWPVLTHVDLLVFVRRLWRDRLLDCRLTTVEREIVGVERRGDIDGAAVAQLLERLLFDCGSWADSDTRGLQCARRHNVLDVVALPNIAVRLAEEFRAPRSLRAAFAVAKLLTSRDRSVAPLRLLERWMDALASQRHVDVCSRDVWLWAARRWGKLGDHDRAEWLLRRLGAVRPGDTLVHDALAKHLEHVRKDLGGARAVTLASDAPCAARLRRLEAKLARQRPPTGADLGASEGLSTLPERGTEDPPLVQRSPASALASQLGVSAPTGLRFRSSMVF